MNRIDIQDGINAHMRDLGVPGDLWTFDRGKAELIFLAGGAVRRVSLRAGMSQREFAHAMGRIAGWWDIIGAGARVNGA